MGPSRIGFRPDSAFAYAVNEGSNNITVIDTASRTVVNTIAVGTSPRDGAICPAGPYAVVYNHGSNDVSIIDATMNVVAATVPVGGDPLNGVFRPDCAFFFVMTAANTVVAIDMTTLTAVAMVPVGTSPVCGTIRPDGAFLYVTNQGSNNVSVIDATNPPFPEVARPTVGTIPLFGGIRPDGAFLFVINRGSNNVTVIDTTSNTVVATIFLGWDLDPDLRLDFTADGNWVYVTNPVSNTVLAGDLVNLVVAPPISVGTRPTHVAIAQIGPF